MKRLALYLVAGMAWGQGWTQWGQNPRHTGAVNVAAQRPEVIQGEFDGFYQAIDYRLREEGEPEQGPAARKF